MIQFFVYIEDTATEEEQKEIAKLMFQSPLVVGVYRQAPILEEHATHATPEATQ